MKKIDLARIMMISLALMVCLIFQMCLFSTYSTKPHQEGNKHLAMKQNMKRDPLDQPPKSTSRTHQTRLIICDRSHKSYDICEINGPTTLDPSTSTFYTTGPTSAQTIRPYPRKLENSTMSRIKELTLISGPLGPQCQVQHKSPALVFSAGGYTGNFFHEFSDGFIPLFITVHSLFGYNRRDLVLVISKSRDWWVHKYSDLFRSFSDHSILNLDNDTVTHCFPSVKLGLISHGIMTINPNYTTGKTLTLGSFRAFLGESFGRRSNSKWRNPTRPRLVLVSRTGRVGRVLENERELKSMAEELGFEVVLFEPTAKTTLSRAYELMNSSHAVVGVHGAGLTNVLFMRHGSTFVQVVPLGVVWLADACFGNAAREMGLEYAEYRIEAHESSLVDTHGRDEMVIKDPVGFRGKGWSDDVMEIYLKEQNIRLDLVRFRVHLKESYRKAKKFMEREG